MNMGNIRNAIKGRNANYALEKRVGLSALNGQGKARDILGRLSNNEN
jgi:hypothetical protein